MMQSGRFFVELFIAGEVHKLHSTCFFDLDRLPVRLTVLEDVIAGRTLLFAVSKLSP